MSNKKEKQKKAKSGCLLLSIILIITVIIIVSSLGDDESKSTKEASFDPVEFDDPMNIGLDSIKKYEGKKWTYDFQDEWGNSKAIEENNNKYGVVYFEKANISMAFLQETKEILFAGFTKESCNKYMKQYKKDRKKLIESQLSGWDGSHKGLNRLIKRKMNDPNSFEHIRTTYRDEGDLIFITTTFTGKNAFGGRVKNSLSARVDFNGNVVEIVE